MSGNIEAGRQLNRFHMRHPSPGSLTIGYANT
jgi:hypothetical protein